MDTRMSAKTRQEALAKRRWRSGRAGKEHKAKILDEVVELFGYHRKAAIRAMRPRAEAEFPCVPGRPKEYDPEKLLPPLKAIWLAALQPCGTRLKACLSDRLPAYETDHRRLDPDVRRALLAAKPVFAGRWTTSAPACPSRFWGSTATTAANSSTTRSCAAAPGRSPPST
jgi:hypothetical protein